MEATPATFDALEMVDRLGETVVGAGLRRIAAEVRDIVPECLGMSLTLVEDNVTLTIVAADDEAPMSAMPRLVEAGTHEEQVGRTEARAAGQPQRPHEGRWSMRPGAGTTPVLGSLTLPLLDQDRVVAGVNLYAGVPDALEAHRDEIAAIVGSWTTEAVRDADRSFSTRLRTAEASDTLANEADVDTAASILASVWDVEHATSRAWLGEAADRAGLREVDLAHDVIRNHLSERA